jgi:hypothetical protein
VRADAHVLRLMLSPVPKEGSLKVGGLMGTF